MTTFLKKLGQILLKGTQIAVGIMPVVQQSFPTSQPVQQVTDTLTAVAGVIAQVEVIGQALGQPGSQKLIAAAPLVAQVVLQSAFMAKHEIADPAKFNAACTTIAGGVADLMNSLKENVETVNKA